MSPERCVKGLLSPMESGKCLLFINLSLLADGNSWQQLFFCWRFQKSPFFGVFKMVCLKWSLNFGKDRVGVCEKK